jgi:glycopeptide antibiotics resistance protein
VVAAVFTVPYVFLLAAYTFAPESASQPGGEEYNLVPLRTIIEQATSGSGAEEFVRQIGGNFVLLLPLGILLGIFGISTGRAAIVVVAAALRRARPRRPVTVNPGLGLTPSVVWN